MKILFKKLFGKKEDVPKEIILYAPLTGEVTPLENVPDPVFSQKMMGDGIAINPNSGEVVSPVDGEVIQVFPTKHAVGIKAHNGAEILIHIGLETVSMDGEGFEAHVSEGSKVKAGDALVSFDIDKVIEKAKSTITPIIITNGDHMSEVKKLSVDEVTAGYSPILEVVAKQ